MVVPSTIERIEPLPPIAVALLNRIPLQPSDQQSLIDTLQSEPALWTKITQVARNSGQYPDTESLLDSIKITDLVEIAITISIHDYLRGALAVTEANNYWRYILACAYCSAELAAPAKVDVLTAYAAGLLHDIGRMALIQGYPARYANLLALADSMFVSEQEFDIIRYEQMLFGFDHFETARWLADVWKLPRWLRPVVGKFDSKASDSPPKLVETIRAGTAVAHSLGFGYLQGAPRARIVNILGKLPGALGHWRALDIWKYGEEHMHIKVGTRLNWYAVLAGPEAGT
jgi:HD-like signal output (HDOD) protein